MNLNDQFTSLFSLSDNRKDQFRIFIAHSSAMMLDFIIQHHVKYWPKYFLDSNRHDPSSFWITPYNKGNLWKIKRTQFYFELYYGTKRIFSANNFQTCLDAINDRDACARIESIIKL